MGYAVYSDLLLLGFGMLLNIQLKIHFLKGAGPYKTQKIAKGLNR